MMLRRHRGVYTDRQLVREPNRAELAAQLELERAKVAALEAELAAAKAKALDVPVLATEPETAPEVPAARRRR